MEEKNSKVFLVISLIVVFLAGLLLGLILGKGLNRDKKKEEQKQEERLENKFYYLGVFQDSKIDDDYYLFTSYADYSSKFDSTDITSNDFDKSNYVVVKYVYNECGESDVKVKGYDIKGNTITVNMTYTASCGVCAPTYLYYLLRVDKDLKDVTVKTDAKALNDPECDPYVSYKPMIYLYPTKKTLVEVKLGKPELLTTTYPKYNNSWKVVANPNGDLYDLNGKYYYGLYWEGNNNIVANYEEGFVVKGEDTIKFLEEKLAILGLNEKEANEFIVYWLPKLEANKYNFIRFEDIDVINEEMPLEISPNPDTVIRVLMEYKPLNSYISVKEQKLEQVQRKGFTVVEWGGTLLK